MYPSNQSSNYDSPIDFSMSRDQTANDNLVENRNWKKRMLVEYGDFSALNIDTPEASTPSQDFGSIPASSFQSYPTREYPAPPLQIPPLVNIPTPTFSRRPMESSALPMDLSVPPTDLSTPPMNLSVTPTDLSAPTSPPETDYHYVLKSQFSNLPVDSDEDTW